jgi:hypothetical protein
MTFFQNLTENFTFLSLIFSLILIIGFYQFGEIILYNSSFGSIIKNISQLKYQKILVGINFIMIILFPLVLFYEDSKYVLDFTSILIFCLGLFKIFKYSKKEKIIKTLNYDDNKFEYLLFLAVIIGYFLISFSPISHADSLSYHLGGAEYIFKTGNLPTALENFEHLLIGSGEVVMSLGVFFGAEQFGNLIQFSALISLIGIIKKLNKNNSFYSLLILSSPVLIFLASSPKPQLFHVISNSVIFTILFLNFNYSKNEKFFSTCLIILVNIFIINSINAKYSFVLSGAILYVLLFFYAYKKKFLIKMFILNFCFLIFFYFGFIYWKYLTWGGDIISYIFNPLPIHLEGMQTFYQYLINYKRETSLIYLIIPKNFAQFTDPLGIGILVFIYFFIKRNKIIIYFAPIFLFIILSNYFFGQPSSRFFFEIYIWMILILAFLNEIKINEKIKIVCYVQFIVSLFAIWYGVFTMSYGFLTKDLRDHVMTNTANGYSLFKWSNSVLNNESDRVVSIHRSVQMSRPDTIATNFANWVRRDKNKIMPYHIKKLLSDHDGSTYLLSFGNKPDLSIFENCIDHLYLKKNNVGRHVGRNPFNNSSLYHGYLFKLKDLKKTNCYKN